MQWVRPCLGLLIASGMAFAADPALLQLVPPDAGAIAGLQVDQGKKSPLGQYVLGHLGQSDAGIAKFVAESGFDPRRDVSEIVFALNALPPGANSVPGAHGLVVARGTFNPGRIESAVIAHGGSVTNFQGIDILSGAAKNGMGALAFLDTTTAALGDIEAIQQAITRRASGAAAGSWSSQAQTLSQDNDFWFLTNGPISGLTSVMPNGQAGPGMQNAQMFQSVTGASGGLKFGANVVFTADAVTRSDKDAQALADVLRFLSGMLQTNKSTNPTAAQLSALLSSLVLSTNANVLHLSLTVPEAQLEGFLTAAHQHQATALSPHSGKPVVN